MDESELYWRAVSAYAKWCKRRGVIFDEPNDAQSEVCGNRILLRTGDRLQAQYYWTGERLLRKQ